MKKILPVFSYIFHPLFIPIFTVLYFFYIDGSYLVPAEKILILLQVLIIMVLIPIAFFFLLRSIGKIETIMVPLVSQRKLPLMMQTVLLFLLLFQSITFDRIPELFFFFLGALASTVVALISAYAKIRISLHMAAIGAMLFFIIGLSVHNQYNALVLIAFLLMATGFVASSRLQMQAHNNKELLAGFLSGIIPQIILWYFWL